MKLLALSLIIFVLIDGCLFDPGFVKGGAQSEIEFVDLSDELAMERAIHVVRKPTLVYALFQKKPVAQIDVSKRSLDHEIRPYSTTPAEVAVNSDA